MGRIVEIEESTFERIQKNDANYQGADAVINRALNALENLSSSRGNHHHKRRRKSSASRESLLFTEIITASIDGQELVRPSWRLVVVQLLKIIKGQYGVDELYAKFGIRAVMGVSNESGYQYEEELDYSLGGFGARDAGKFIERIANDIGFSVEIRYRWIEGGSRPGEESYLRINAKPHAPRLSAVD